MAQAALPLFLVACALKRFGAQARKRRCDVLLCTTHSSDGFILSLPVLSKTLRLSKGACRRIEGGALHLNVFEQPADSDFFKNLLLLCQTNSFTIPSFRVKREIL